jgi:hypothetical protein
MPFKKTVLALARTFNTTVRLLDVLPELLHDHRIQVLFALSDERSSFDDGTIDLIQKVGGRIVPWEQALATEFDLIIGASFTGGFRRLRGPQMIISHGTGIAKTTAIPPGGEVETSDVWAPDQQAGDQDEMTRTVNVIAHSFELEIFAADQPEGVSFLVAGDPCFDRLEASLSGFERYRRAMEVPDGVKLVVITSTWGPHSLLFQDPGLPARLVAELPTDEFRVAMILHPNIWFGHGGWQVRTWLRRALAGGLALVPPQDAWRGALVAADLVIGDHGAVTFYGAGLGKTVLLASDGDEEVVRDTPSERLMRAAPKLVASEPLLPQVEVALEEHREDRYDAIINSMFEYRGEALERMRDEIYRILDLKPPATMPQVLAVDLPSVERTMVTAHWVFAQRDRGITSISRHPTALAHVPPPPPPPNFHHLVAEEIEPNVRLRESASIIARDRNAEAPGAREWAKKTLHAYPGVRLAAVVKRDVSVEIFSRHRNPVLIAFSKVEGGRHLPDPSLLASAFYVWEAAGEIDSGAVKTGEIKIGKESFGLIAGPLTPVPDSARTS